MSIIILVLKYDIMIGHDNLMSLFLDRWATLKDALVHKRSQLGESQNLQQFIRDVDDIEGWISEKMQTALEESYKDPANIQV